MTLMTSECSDHAASCMRSTSAFATSMSNPSELSICPDLIYPNYSFADWLDPAQECLLAKMVPKSEPTRAVARSDSDVAAALGALASEMQQCIEDQLLRATFGIMGRRWYIAMFDELLWLDFEPGEAVPRLPAKEEILPVGESCQSPSGARFSVLWSEQIRGTDGRVWDPPNVVGLTLLRAYDERGCFALAGLDETRLSVWVYRNEWQPHWRSISVWQDRDSLIQVENAIDLVHDGDDLHVVWTDLDNSNTPVLRIRNLCKWVDDEPADKDVRYEFVHRIRNLAVTGTCVWACDGTDKLYVVDIANAVARAELVKELRYRSVTSLTSNGSNLLLVGCSDMTAILVKVMDTASIAVLGTFKPARYALYEKVLEAYPPLIHTSKLLMDALDVAAKAGNVALVRMLCVHIGPFRQYESRMQQVLLSACRTGNPCLVGFLLNFGLRPTGKHLHAAIDSIVHGYDVYDIVFQLLVHLTFTDIKPAVFTHAIERLSYCAPRVYRSVATALMRRGVRIPSWAILQLCSFGYFPEDVEIRQMQTSGAKVNWRDPLEGGSVGLRAIGSNDMEYLKKTVINTGYVPDDADVEGLFEKALPFEQTFQWLWLLGLAANVEGVAARRQLRPCQRRAVQQLSRKWQPNEHHLHLPFVRKVVSTVLLIAERLRTVDGLVALPSEMWHHVLQSLSMHPSEFSFLILSMQ